MRILHSMKKKQNLRLNVLSFVKLNANRNLYNEQPIYTKKYIILFDLKVEGGELYSR